MKTFIKFRDDDIKYLAECCYNINRIYVSGNDITLPEWKNTDEIYQKSYIDGVKNNLYDLFERDKSLSEIHEEYRIQKKERGLPEILSWEELSNFDKGKVELFKYTILLHIPYLKNHATIIRQ